MASEPEPVARYNMGTDVEVVKAALPNTEVFYASQVQVPGFARKRVFNALTYMTRRGDITRIGYGKYQRPPDFALHQAKSPSEEHFDVR